MALIEHSLGNVNITWYSLWVNRIIHKKNKTIRKIREKLSVLIFGLISIGYRILIDSKIDECADMERQNQIVYIQSNSFNYFFKSMVKKESSSFLDK